MNERVHGEEVSGEEWIETFLPPPSFSFSSSHSASFLPSFFPHYQTALPELLVFVTTAHGVEEFLAPGGVHCPLAGDGDHQQ